MPRRANFARAMAARVIMTLRSEPRLAGVAVVTADGEVAALARSLGVRVIAERAPASLTAAVAHGFEVLAGEGAAGTLILPADLPLLRAEDVSALIETRAEGAVTIVPSRDGEGTNGLLVGRAPSCLFAFGPGSASRHCVRAAAAGLSPCIADLASIAFDVDTPADLDDLLACDLDEPIRAPLADLAARMCLGPVG
jgi:2-phospho-L-lactate guanylyltransferase